MRRGVGRTPSNVRTLVLHGNGKVQSRLGPEICRTQTSHCDGNIQERIMLDRLANAKSCSHVGRPSFLPRVRAVLCPTDRAASADRTFSPRRPHLAPPL